VVDFNNEIIEMVFAVEWVAGRPGRCFDRLVVTPVRRLVIEGTATVRRNDKKIATVGAGTCVGELSLLDHGPRTATVVADTELSALVIGVREFSSIVDEVPSIAHKLLRALATRIRDLDTKIYG